MPKLRSCPSLPELHQFLLGQVPEQDTDVFQRHIKECPRCLSALASMKAADTLVEAMRAQANHGQESADRVVDDLMVKLNSLKPAPVATGETADFAADRAARSFDTDTLSERPGAVIGPYKLLEQIGEGGMGAVFLAEQTHPVRRQVALKIIKPGMDSRQIIARFEAERQALALMDHPNIAKVFDAGTIPTLQISDCRLQIEEHPLASANLQSEICNLQSPGRPYFVMELVKGAPITRYCDEHHLTPRQRLELFISVCQAVQHAHQKGIIHRDLKPSNVLVAEYDDKPVAKVIDFGIAKATGPKLTERTMFTEIGQIVGTLEYMSPEQANLNPLDVDTRSDIYSLGVLLYELLTGTTPFERKRLKDAAIDELLRIIREEEPPKPSTRLSTTEELPAIAANRGLEPKKLHGLLRGELDWIVMKALEKDRGRRYQTANDFAMDVHRYLADEPVQACPPSVGYRLRKSVRRNKLALSGTAVITLGLVTAAVALAISNVRVNTALTEKDEALTERTQALQERTQALGDRTTALAAETLAKNTLQDALDREKDTVYEQGVALADREWLDGNVGRALEILSACPKEQRDWEWHYLKRRCQTNGFSFAAVPGIGGDWVGTQSPDGKLLAICDREKIHVLDALTGRTIQSLAAVKAANGGDVKFSRNGKRLAWVLDSKVVIWDLGTAQQIVEFSTGDKHVMSLVINDDGSRLVSTHENDSAFLWDARNGKQVCQLWAEKEGLYKPPSIRAVRAAFNSAGRLALASGRTVSIHAADTGKKLFAFQHFCDVSALAYHAGLRVVVTGDHLGNVSLWTEEGRLLMIVSHRQLMVTHVAISPDAEGRWVAWVGLRDQTVKVSDWRKQDNWIQRQHNEVQVFRGHLGHVSSIAFRDDEHLASLGYVDRTVMHWNVKAGQQYRILSDQYQHVALAFSGNGRYLVSGDQVWDVNGLTTVFRVPDPSFGCVDMTADGKYVLALDRNTSRKVKVWDVPAGKDIFSLDEKRFTIFETSISPDGRSIASIGVDGSLRILDIKTGQEVLLRAPAAEKELRSLAFSPDGKRLAAVDNFAGFALHIWDLSTHQQLLSLRNNFWFHCPTFSADSRYVAGICGEEVTIRDAKSGQIQFTLPVGRGTKWITFSASGKRLASLGTDGRLRIWDIKTGRSLLALQAPPRTHYRVAFSPDGTLLAANGPGGLWIWDATPGQDKGGLPGLLLHEVRRLGRHEGTVHQAVISRDGRRVLSGGSDQTVRLWDAESGKQLRRIDVGDGKQNHTIHAVALSPDGRRALAASQSGTVWLWDLDNGKELGSCQHPGVNSVAIARDGQNALLSNYEGLIAFWDLEKWQESRRFQTMRGLWSVDFAPDGRTALIAGGADDWAILSSWDLQTGKELRRFEERISKGIWRALFSPDGRHVLSAGIDKIVRLWEVKTGKQLREFTGHTGQVRAVAFSPDGRRAVSGADDGSVRLWDVETGKELHHLVGRAGGLMTVAFSPDGRQALYAGEDGWLRLWSLPSKEKT